MICAGGKMDGSMCCIRMLGDIRQAFLDYAINRDVDSFTQIGKVSGKIQGTSGIHVSLLPGSNLILQRLDQAEIIKNARPETLHHRMNYFVNA